MINPENTKMELNVRAIRTFLPGFENIYGKKELVKLIESTGMPLDYFKDENNWISFDYYCSLLDALVAYTGCVEIPYKFGLNAGSGKSWGIIKTIVTSIASCSYAYKKVISLSPRWAKAGTFNLLNIKNNNATIEYKLRQNLKQTKNNCLLGIQSQLASIPTYWNLPPATIHELQCAAEGADSCIYELEWQNPPYKKSGLYSLLLGIIISVIFYLLVFQFKKINLMFIANFLSLIIPIMLYSIWKTYNQRKILKYNFKKTEEQNELLTKYLIKAEKVNEVLQKKIEERTEELLQSNNDLEKNLMELENNEDQLVQFEKIATIGQIAVEIAEKLEKPVNSVQNRLRSLFDVTPDNDLIYDSLAGALKSAGRCEKIINDLLTFSGNGNNFLNREIDINSIIDNCATKAYEIISNPNITIATNLLNNLPKIMADPTQLEQAFMIFLMNAHDAIYTAIKNNNIQGGKIHIKSFLKNGGIIIEIYDTGCGIPRDIINKIFDPFFSTKKTSTRKGMGLTLAFNIIKKLGGSIQVKSVVNSETTFSIYIPAERK